MSELFAVVTAIGVTYSIVQGAWHGYKERSVSWGFKAFLAGLLGTGIGLLIILMFLGLVTVLLSIFDQLFYS